MLQVRRRVFKSAGNKRLNVSLPLPPTPAGALILRIYQVVQQCKFAISTTHLYFFIRVIAESALLCFSITFAHFLVWFGSSRFAINVIAALVG